MIRLWTNLLESRRNSLLASWAFLEAQDILFGCFYFCFFNHQPLRWMINFWFLFQNGRSFVILHFTFLDSQFIKRILNYGLLFLFLEYLYTTMPRRYRNFFDRWELWLYWLRGKATRFLKLVEGRCKIERVVVRNNKGSFLLYQVWLKHQFAVNNIV